MLSSLIVNGQPLTAPSDEPITPWWSFTKTVLATTALTLVRDRLIGLDDPVDAQPFTLRQLLRHEAGLADYGELADYHAAVARGEPAWSPDEMIRRLDGDRLRYPPGTGWGYSNVGYMLISRLIERLTDRPLEEAVTQRALFPLGLANVHFAKTPADLHMTHLGNASNYDPAWVYHGLLIGPLSQAALFLDGLLGADLLPGPLLQEMQTARALGGPIPGRPWATAGYGLGVMQGSVEAGHSVCGHTGCGPGSVIAVYRICEGDASTCCAAFDAGDSQGAVESEVIATMLGALRQRT
jgi:CubicO group peptidase (beta-lactamase class C family)